MSTIGEQRILLIETAISKALAPGHLEVEDESHLHAGHAGAKTGMGHFHVTVVADAFDELRMLRRHRLIYDAVGDLMQSDIHALRIDAHSSTEFK